MLKQKIKLVLLNSLILSLLFLKFAFAAGLSTTFSEVTAGNLKLGQEYSLKEKADFPLKVSNLSQEALLLHVEVLIPQQQDLISGYWALPDKSWVRLEQDQYEIGPGESAVSDVIICVPDDEQYRGQKYQVYLWSHTVGVGLGLGLRSRLLLEIEE